MWAYSPICNFPSVPSFVCICAVIIRTHVPLRASLPTLARQHTTVAQPAKVINSYAETRGSTHCQNAGVFDFASEFACHDKSIRCAWSRPALLCSSRHCCHSTWQPMRQWSSSRSHRRHAGCPPVTQIGFMRWATQYRRSTCMSRKREAR